MNTVTGSWICSVCGYVHQGAAAPECCPVCGAAASDFEPYSQPVDREKEPDPNQWRCMNCSYIHKGTEPPELCPLCGASSDRFEPASEPAAAGHADAALNIVIIGGGIAGVSAAETVRQTAPDSNIIMLCHEPILPYYRLNLTRYLGGEIKSDKLPVYESDWYSDQKIDLRIGTAVEKVDPANQTVELAAGETLKYDKLIMAMGSHPFIPPLPGTALDGVTSLRTAEDADNILLRLKKDKRCIVIGGGILGLETAGALGRIGAEITLIESHDWLMPRQLNSKAAGILESYMLKLGVRLRKNARTARILGEEKVTGIELDNGESIPAGTIILATGVRPNTVLARKAGLEVDKGIIVNNRLQSSLPDIYAAGDVAEHNGLLYGAWAPSQYQGRIAALNACGIASEFGGMPRSNSLKVLGIDMLSIGRFEPEDGSYLTLDKEENGQLAHFVFHDGRMTGSILVGYPALGPAVKRSVEERKDFSAILRSARSGNDIINYLSA